MFGQLFTQLEVMPSLEPLRQSERAWKVDFQGEGATDQGGPYRESITQMSVELQGDALDLFIPSPNKRSDLGDTREKFVVNPLATSHRHLRFFRVSALPLFLSPQINLIRLI